MAVDLEDLIPYFQAEMSMPGATFAGTNAQLVLRLANAFWEARLDGLFPNYREEDGLIVPISGTEDLPREYQQLLILLAAYAVVLNDLRNAQAQFSAKAGPVEYSTQRSVTVLRDVLAAMNIRLRNLVDRIAALYSGGDSYLIDAYMARTCAMGAGEVYWVR